ncbi:LPS sulfotransferase NodH [Loktanella ponticola]|uniref:LPS sulfotransferase NodH n=1 Tax=Yoonia ponticola TaxID=1524255 RepID=A0A7W9BJB9_9RHOB|nr:sulfotransferase family 2 domain-containing protein [Yoonia ponticola]MBB5721381.1 LPS sulfotransferase NodH [Yoonia ponticola]
MSRFDYFVVFAEMRTGSNFLEANINSFDGLTCHGEAFNPHFVGFPNVDNILGVTRDMREADPIGLINTIKTKTQGLGGFRFFNNHDARALAEILPDPRCAKIVLTRNPIDSYVSWKIAKATGQWKLTNIKHARSSQVKFDAAEFEQHMADLQAFQVTLLNTLQKSGQTAFFVAYEDLQDVDVMNGLAAFLGTESRIDALDKKLKKQNPEPLEDKLVNFDAMAQALARMDRFNLNRTPNFEPRRGPNVPTFIAAPRAPLLYLPLKSGPVDVVTDWLSQLDDGAEVLTKFSQKSLRQWKSAYTDHRTFTVLRHPLSRAHAVFCDRILSTMNDSFPEIRASLIKQHGVPIPKFDPLRDPDAGYDMDAHKTAFLAFLGFLKKNLAGQTSLRVDPAWASQLSLLQGMADFTIPDLIVREDRMGHDLAILAAHIGRETMPGIPEVTDPHAQRLAEIYDADIEAAGRDVYQRDYVAFGFGNWA